MWIIDARPGRIIVRTYGELDVGKARRATKRLEEELNKSSEQCMLVIDLHELHGYDDEVRRMWQDLLTRNRTRFTQIMWVSDSRLFRMIAASVSLIVGIRGRVVGSREYPILAACA